MVSRWGDRRGEPLIDLLAYWLVWIGWPAVIFAYVFMLHRDLVRTDSDDSADKRKTGEKGKTDDEND